MEKLMDGLKKKLPKEWMDERTNGWMDGQTDGEMGGQSLLYFSRMCKYT